MPKPGFVDNYEPCGAFEKGFDIKLTFPLRYDLMTIPEALSRLIPS